MMELTAPVASTVNRGSEPRVPGPVPWRRVRIS